MPNNGIYPAAMLFESKRINCINKQNIHSWSLNINLFSMRLRHRWYCEGYIQRQENVFILHCMYKTYRADSETGQQSGLINYYEINICCFSAKHIA